MDTHNHLPTWILYTRDGYVSRDRLLAELHRHELRLAMPREASRATRILARMRAVGENVGRASAEPTAGPACCPA